MCPYKITWCKSILFVYYTYTPTLLLLSDQPLLSEHLPFPRGWPLNRDFTVLIGIVRINGIVEGNNSLLRYSLQNVYSTQSYRQLSLATICKDTENRAIVTYICVSLILFKHVWKVFNKTNTISSTVNIQTYLTYHLQWNCNKFISKCRYKNNVWH